MIVEVRTYTVKPGLRDKFIEFFETKVGPAQQRMEIPIMGPFLDLENPDVFVWLRTFSDMPERDRLKNDFYEGWEWKGGLEAEAMGMLESFKAIICQSSPRMFYFDDVATAAT